MAAFKTVTVAESVQLINEQQPVILDCRDVNAYKAGHLDNAMHLHEQLRESLLRKADKNRPLLIYCYHGHASEHVAEMFADFGFKQVYSMAGGYAVWSQHHNPTGDL